ncbi:acetyl-CoA carboxylase biotin carboxyl carrier protein [Bacillus carboniphilus]|uniref:Biotin carboxyl carrier protein of acetyl-CoA carboxylase n=1 Tax=Bacillus carboniphilus TaxID=86663 RepID=A0ABY9JWX2_9BACI|nr:acetyl-CoA carboxylase biotin carboxyl carrier protein [Bacillus carboniphilus]WLR43886.1 acetyl-CoA carboxylase biotin carboxyl carrier protein [Bacillus carboniphilus]
MLKVQEIRELIKLIDESTINEFTYENEGTTVKMKKGEVVLRSENATQQQVKEVIPTPPIEEKNESNQPKAVENNQPKEKEIARSEENLKEITSPMVGTFYSASSPEAEPYVKVGSKVKKDSVVCIIEAMKLFNEIEAEVQGEIVEILVENGQLLEYGQPLFLVKPE